MNSKITFGIGGVIVGLLMASFLTSTLLPYRNSIFGMMGQRNNIDRHFIEQMIPHHEGAVTMAQLALTKSKRTEIKTLATAIIDSQTKEINDMKIWYKEWFGVDAPKVSTGMMGGGMMSSNGMHMGGQEEIAQLQNADDFDKAFIESMIPHHQLALMMARMLETGTNRPEMLQLAKNILSSQSKEIQDMRNWYTAWY